MTELSKREKKNRNVLQLLFAVAFLLISGITSCNRVKERVTVSADTTATPPDGTLIDTTIYNWTSINRSTAATKIEDLGGSGILVRGNERYRIYEIEESLIFKPFKTDLTDSAKKKVKLLVSFLKENPDDDENTIYIYAEQAGTRLPDKLSKERAEILSVLMKKTGNNAAERIMVAPINASDNAIRRLHIVRLKK